MSERESASLRAGDEARFVGSWGLLLEAGLPEPELLEHLAGEPLPPPLGALAGACARALRAGPSLQAALDEHAGEPGTGLSSWLHALLAASPRRAEHLRAAAEQVLDEQEHGRRREQVWERLALLLRAGAPAGEALGAIARLAREREERALADALLAGARAARQGGDWVEAVRAALEPTERLLLTPADPVAGLSRLAAHTALLRRAAVTSPTEALQRIAEAAQAGAAPLRRGLGRVLSGLEDAFGRGGAKPPEEGRDLAKKTVASRGAPEPTPPASAAAPPATPATPPGAGGKKTIGEDSGPVLLDPHGPR